MRIGLVRFLNARPLDYALRQSKDASIEWMEDTPARLYEKLSAGELDAALISSVECLRNRDRFGYCQKVGVCASGPARSILYIADNTTATEDRPAKIDTLLADEGSRSSVALLRILHQLEHGTDPKIKATDPAQIPDRVEGTTGGLLIGDSALAYAKNTPANHAITDLGAWWHRRERLPFVFALWAYPVEQPIADSFFEELLTTGLGALDQIVAGAKLEDARTYLSQNLHYRLGESEAAALHRFQSYLERFGLL